MKTGIPFKIRVNKEKTVVTQVGAIAISNVPV